MDRSEARASRSAGRLAILTLALSMLLASLGTSIANIALPALANAFSASLHNIQWVVVAYLAALTVSVVFVGRLGDRFGLRKMYVVGLVLFSVASLLCAIAPSLWFLIGARVLQGIGAAFLMTLAIALVRETADQDRIGRAMGLLGTISALGTALGPSLGGVLLSAANWRGVFVVLVPIALVTLALAHCTLPSCARNASLPSMRLSVLRSPGLAPSLIANLLVAAVMMATLVIGPFFLGLALGLGPVSVGIVMSIGPVIAIFAGVLSGRLVDARGANLVILVGLVALTVGAVSLAFLPQFFEVAGYVVAILILTPGYQLFQSANNTAVIADVPADRRGLMSGLLGLSRNLGLVFGASATGTVFAWGTGTGAIDEATPSAIAGGMQLTFLLSAGLMVIALGIMVRRDSRNPML